MKDQAKSVRVAAIQMESGADIRANLDQAKELLHQAVRHGCDLVVFPENFALMTDDADELRAQALELRSPLVQELQEWAAESDVWIVAGTLPMKLKGESRLANMSLVFNWEGEIAAKYHKIHLFDAEPEGDRTYQESKEFKPGKKPVLIRETPVGGLGLSVCYDVRFPELYRKYSKGGAHAFAIPAAFTRPTGQAHWDVLTRARAIENQCVVIAAAQTGKHPGGRETWGHSRIIDAWGRVLAERTGGVGLVWAELDFDEVRDLRRRMPVLGHRVL